MRRLWILTTSLSAVFQAIARAPFTASVANLGAPSGSEIIPTVSFITNRTSGLPGNVTTGMSVSVRLSESYLSELFKKWIARPVLAFKALHSANATLVGIETADIIRKRQLDSNWLTEFQQFAEPAA